METETIVSSLPPLAEPQGKRYLTIQAACLEHVQFDVAAISAEFCQKRISWRQAADHAAPFQLDNP